MAIYNVGAYLGDNENRYSAVSKPIADVIKIMSGMGVQDIGSISNVPDLFGKRLSSKASLDKAFARLHTGDVLVIQYPLYLNYPAAPQILRFLAKKKIKTIAFIHDINPLRFTERSFKDNVLRPSTKMSYSVQCLNLFTHIIYPNLSMEKKMKINGVRISSNTLKFYDYLVPDGHFSDKSDNLTGDSNFRKIFFAGNLDKSSFLGQYRATNNDVKFIVFGQKPTNYVLPKTIDYQGTKSPDQLPHFLKNGLGLVWDGTSADSIHGGWGEYLRYNNPYKASSYLAAGIPLIVWRESALANIVTKEQIGILIDSLPDAERQVADMTQSEFKIMVANVMKFREKLLNGEFTRSAVKEALDSVSA